MRGVSQRVLAVRDNVSIVQGRFLTPGLYRAGRRQQRARRRTRGSTWARRCASEPGTWTVVGIFDAGGSAFDSEVWADADVAQRHLPAPARRLPVGDRAAAIGGRLPGLRDGAQGRSARSSCRRSREQAYYEQQSQLVTTLITVLGTLVASVMALGAVIGALNTMYSAVAERSREIAVLRALGFGGGSIVAVVLRRVAVDRAHRRARRLRRRAAGQRHHDRHHQLADLLAPVVCVPDHARPAPVRHRVRALDGRGRRRAAGDPRGARERVDHDTRAVATPECRALASTAQAS